MSSALSVTLSLHTDTVAEKQNETIENKLPSIEVGPTALAWPMILTYDIDLQSRANYIRSWPAHVQTFKVNGQSVPKRVERNGETDRRADGRRDCITSLANAVDKLNMSIYI